MSFCTTGEAKCYNINEDLSKIYHEMLDVVVPTFFTFCQFFSDVVQRQSRFELMFFFKKQHLSVVTFELKPAVIATVTKFTILIGAVRAYL